MRGSEGFWVSKKSVCNSKAYWRARRSEDCGTDIGPFSHRDRGLSWQLWAARRVCLRGHPVVLDAPHCLFRTYLFHHHRSRRSSWRSHSCHIVYSFLTAPPAQQHLQSDQITPTHLLFPAFALEEDFRSAGLAEDPLCRGCRIMILWVLIGSCRLSSARRPILRRCTS